MEAAAPPPGFSRPTVPRLPPPSVLTLRRPPCTPDRKEEGEGRRGDGAHGEEEPPGKAVRRAGGGALLFGTIARADDVRLARIRSRIADGRKRAGTGAARVAA